MTGKKRVYELAREFGVKSPDLLDLLRAANIVVKSHASWVYEDEARAVLEKALPPRSNQKRAGMTIIRKRTK